MRGSCQNIVNLEHVRDLRRAGLPGVLGLDGPVAMMSIQVATSTRVSVASLDRVLLPGPVQRSKLGATLATDNLAPHEAATVRERVEGAGLELRFLSRHSPDLSPVEPCWSKTKAPLRAKEAHAVEALDRELPGVLDAISAQTPEAGSATAAVRLQAERKSALAS